MTAAATATNTMGATATKPLRVQSTIHFPLRKAISRRLWKVWGVGLFGLLIGAGIVGAGYFDELRGQELGPGFHTLFDLSAARAIRYFSSIQILLAGQLALFIWWARSRTQNNQSYRYRTWAWMATICFIASFAMGIDAPRAVTETLAWSAGEQASIQPELGWMIPAGCCMLGMLWLLHADVRHCRTSLVLLWMAAMSWVAGAAMGRVFDIPMDPLSSSAVQTGTVMFGHWCLLMSLLVHARHVVYSPAEQRHSETVAKRTKAVAKTGVAATEKPAVKASASTRTVKSQATFAKAGEIRRIDGPETIADKAKNVALVTRTDLREQRAKAAVIDKSMLKGLSKRERRQVRKQFREQQRELHGEAYDD